MEQRNKSVIYHSYFIPYYELKSLNKTEQTFANLFCCEHAAVMGGNELAQSLLGFIHTLNTNKIISHKTTVKTTKFEKSKIICLQRFFVFFFIMRKLTLSKLTSSWSAECFENLI